MESLFAMAQKLNPCFRWKPNDYCLPKVSTSNIIYKRQNHHFCLALDFSIIILCLRFCIAGRRCSICSLFVLLGWSGQWQRKESYSHRIIIIIIVLAWWTRLCLNLAASKAMAIPIKWTEMNFDSLCCFSNQIFRK